MTASLPPHFPAFTAAVKQARLEVRSVKRERERGNGGSAVQPGDGGDSRNTSGKMKVKCCVEHSQSSRVFDVCSFHHSLCILLPSLYTHLLILYSSIVPCMASCVGVEITDIVGVRLLTL